MSLVAGQGHSPNILEVRNNREKNKRVRFYYRKSMGTTADIDMYTLFWRNKKYENILEKALKFRYKSSKYIYDYEWIKNLNGRTKWKFS